jgi:hypothetical protein
MLFDGGRTTIRIVTTGGSNKEVVQFESTTTIINKKAYYATDPELAQELAPHRRNQLYKPLTLVNLFCWNSL